MSHCTMQVYHRHLVKPHIANTMTALIYIVMILMATKLLWYLSSVAIC